MMGGCDDLYCDLCGLYVPEGPDDICMCSGFGITRSQGRNTEEHTMSTEDDDKQAAVCEFADQWLSIFDEIFDSTGVMNEVYQHLSEEDLCSILDRMADGPRKGHVLCGSGFYFYALALQAWAHTLSRLDQLMRDHPGRWTDDFEPWWPEFDLYQMLKKRFSSDRARQAGS